MTIVNWIWVFIVAICVSAQAGLLSARKTPVGIACFVITICFFIITLSMAIISTLKI